MTALRFAALAVVFVTINAQTGTPAGQGAGAANPSTAMTPSPQSGGATPGGAMVNNLGGGVGYGGMPPNPFQNPYANNFYMDPFQNPYAYRQQPPFGYNNMGYDTMGYGGQYGSQYGGQYGGGHGGNMHGSGRPNEQTSRQNSFNDLFPFIALGGDTARQMALFSSFSGQGRGGNSFFPAYAASGALGDAAQQAMLFSGAFGGQGRGGNNLPVWAALSGNDNLLPWVLSGLGQGQNQGQGQGQGRQGRYNSQPQNPFGNAWQYMMLGGYM